MLIVTSLVRDGDRIDSPGIMRVAIKMSSISAHFCHITTACYITGTRESKIHCVGLFCDGARTIDMLIMYASVRRPLTGDVRRARNVDIPITHLHVNVHATGVNVNASAPAARRV